MNKAILMGRLTRDPETRYSQGYTQDDNADTVQKIADAINMCYLHSVITEGEWVKAKERLYKKLENKIKKMED